MEEAQTLHLLSPALSDISESSIATVVNSPSPSHFHQGFGCEPSSNGATQDKDASTVHLLLDDASIVSEAHHTNSRDSSHHDVSAPPTYRTSGRTWPLNASRKSHVYHSHVIPDSLEKAQCKGLEVGEDAIPSFESTAPELIRKGRKDLVSIVILAISLYSTIMSALWLVIAAYRPHWGHRVSSHGMMKPDNASLISTLVAKSIELSLGTAFVAFLGQKLSHRAFSNPSRGISIAEMSMRAWVVQPGSMLAHWNILRNGILSWLGLATFFVAWLAMLYTSASDVLISPRLLPGAVVKKVLYGDVRTSFANVEYITRQCQTPISPDFDPVYSGSTCDAIAQAGQGYHNFAQYMSDWTNYTAHGNGSFDLRDRPRVPATLYGNTTVIGSWVDVWNMTQISNGHGRIVNNVSLAFPHPGVAAAAQDVRNKILQPAELGGQGQYSIQASVSSPTVNVLCASMTDEELSYMIWPAGSPPYPSWLRTTAVDDVFGFGKGHGRRPPAFPMKAPPYNSILNHSGIGADSIYVLATAADNSSMVCSLRASISVSCSTIYQASATGGQLESHCEDPNDSNSYLHSVVDAPSGIMQPDWSSVGQDWGLAMALDGGQKGANASTTRLLTQFIPEKQNLDPNMPSIAEALAALAGSTLLLGAQDSPFVHYWNYTQHIIAAVPQGFNATVKAYEYQSRYEQKWQQVFYIVLVGTFIANCYCFVYLAWNSKFLMDVTEPENLFDMGFSSLPSKGSEGAFYAASKKDRYGRKWAVKVDQDQHVHFESVPRSRSTEYEKRGSYPEECKG